MKFAAIILAAVSLAPLIRSTNSRVAAQRGIEAFEKKNYGHAVDSFAQSNAIHPNATTLFDLGTSQIAGGRREEGSTTLSKTINDKSLRADALYNRGNSALASKAYDYAIRDYIETLKLRPGDARAKRNLEIALLRKQSMQQSSGGDQKNPKGSQQGQQQQNQQPRTGQKRENQPKGDANAEALLRAVQQQEQEELSRMKKGREEQKRVGW